MILLNVIFNVIRQILVYFIRDIFKILYDKFRILHANFMRGVEDGLRISENLLREMGEM